MATVRTSHRGHNAYAPGASGNGLREHEVAQKIHNKIKSVTKSIDCTDDAGRTANDNLYNIVAKMNQVGVGLHMSQHLNAFNGSANGFEVWYYLGDSAGKKAAEDICKEVCTVTGWVNRGAKATTSLYVIRASKGTAILPEWGFIDSKKDMDILFKSGMMDKAVNAALGALGYNTTVQPPKTQTKPATSKPASKPKPAGLAKNSKPLTDGKVGDTVKVYDALYANSEGAGRSTASRGKQGKIKRIVGNSKKYLIENWGWAHPNDIQLVKRATTSKPTPAKPKPTTSSKPQAREYAESGTFTITDGPIALRLGPTKNSKFISWLGNGESVKYDRVRVDVNGHVWVRQTPKRKEGYAWIATGKTNANAQRGNNPRWGTFK